MTVSTETLNRIFVILVYVPVVLTTYRWLIPRLSLTSKRLASSMLAAQVLVIVVSLELQPTSLLDEWLWSIDGEWNIPSTLASTQLAMVGSIALFTAWLARTKSAWQRLCLVEIGAVLLFLALDEYFDIGRFLFSDRRLGYTLLGVTIVLSSTVVALRPARRSWLWHISLLAGLALIAMGGVVLDDRSLICGKLGFFRTQGGCLDTWYLEESLEFIGGWLALVAMLGWFSGIAPMPRLLVRSALYVLPILWILLLILESPVPNSHKYKCRHRVQSASVQFESGEYLYGYNIEKNVGVVILRLYSFPWQSVYKGLGYSVHLVDQVNGESAASRDNSLGRNHVFRLFCRSFIKVYAQKTEIEILPETPVNRAFWIVLTIWREQEGDFVRQKVLSSDHQLLDDTQVVLGELVIPAESVASDGVPVAIFDNGFSLAAVEMPERAEPGQSLSIGFTWHSDAQGQEDYAQFLHFVNEESSSWWNFDQQPLGPRLPTRLWYNGLADVEDWQIPVPADLAPGQYAVYTGLYQLRNQERVPVSSADGAPWLDARLLLGNLVLE